MKIEIKSIFGSLLFECEANSLKEAVVGAASIHANLRGANLIGADLIGANLRGSDLRGSDLMGANLIGSKLSGANLRGANLSGANLMGSNLRDANLMGSNLRDANLRGANLMDANLMDANLMGASLMGSNLSGASLMGANLRGANLMGSNLMGSNLMDADIRGANLRGANNIFLQCPEIGQFTAFKKCQDNRIVTLLIPEDAKRSSSTSRKCRCDKAIVKAIDDGKKQYETAVSKYSSNFIYKVGKEVSVDNFCENRWEECAAGIHFFITRKEAEGY